MASGWGRDTWSSGTWGEPTSVSVNVPVTGVSATGGVGTVSVAAEANVPETGLFATGGVGSVTIVAVTNVSLSGNQLTQNFSPEYDLTLDGALPSGQIDGNFTGRYQSITFAGEVQLPSSFSQTECLWEHGGEGVGSWLGVSKILNTYYLRFRAGEGVDTVQDNTPGDICLQNVAISNIPEFDGNTHTVVFSIKPNGGTVKSQILLWIDGREVINTQKTTELETGGWSGGNVGGWGEGFSSIAGGTSTYDSGTTQYQATTAWSGTIVSALRYYAGELPDFGATVNVLTGTSVTVSGVSATGQVGSVTIEADANVPETGLAGTGQTGSVTITADANVTETGVSGTGQVGSVTTIADADISVTGVAGTGQLGSVTITADANVPETGLFATGGVGSVSITADANVTETGLAATTNVGSVTITATANVSPTGISATTAVGDETVIADANVIVTGVSATTGINSVTVTADANVPETGLAATGQVGTVSITGTAVISPTGESATGQVGTATAFADVDVSVTGESATGQVGDSTIVIDVNVPQTGLSATGQVGTVEVGIGITASVTGVSASVILPAPISFSGFGDAQISTAQSKFGGASLLLDGSGDYLESQETYNFGSDPFTIDMWVRPTSGTQDAVFFDSRDSTSNNALALRQATDNLLVIRANGTLFNINGVFSANTWVHIAVTRGDPFGNTYSVFVDGVKVDSTLFGTTATAATIHVGSDFNGSNTWEGYVDELRVSAVDRYDGNDFTPPTSAYTEIEDTPVLLHFDGGNGSTTFTNSGFVQAVIVTADANVFPTGVDATGEVGTPEISGDANVPTTGLPVTGSVGTVSITGTANVSLTGESLSAQVGNVFVWGEVVPDQLPSWSEETPSQTPSWTGVTPSQTPGWEDAA